MPLTNSLANGHRIYQASDGWLWRFRNRHGIRNNVEHGECGSADISAVEPMRPEFNRLISKENLHLGLHYNADETALFWRSLPKNTLAFKNESLMPKKR